MSNLKKVLSVGLASTMVMGMVATSAAAATYDKFSDKEDIVNKEAVSMVTELGIIAGLTDGTYAPKQNIDRASFARLVCVALNGGKEPQLGNLKTTFTDTQGNWAEKYIAYCVQQGIIAGKGNNTFAPSANVTGSEAAKMLLVALGYNTTYEKIGGANWQTSTDVLANQAGLYDELGAMNTSAPLTRDNAAQMIYNTLNATKVKYEMVPGISANGQVTMTAQRVNVTKDVNGTTHDVTMLEDAFDAVKVEGVVVANEFANLSSSADKGSALDEGKTKIVVTNGEDQKTFGDGTYSVSTGADQLGKEVILYVKNDSSNTSKATVLGNAIISEDNKVVTSASNKNVDKLADDNDLDVVSSTLVAFNYGGAKKWGDLSDTEKKDIGAVKDNRGVTKTVIDTDDDGDVDYILLNQLYFGKVSKYSTKDDGSITVDVSGKADPALTADDKADVVGFDDVKKDDYVLAAWMGGDLHVQKAESITGKLESYKVGETLTVNGTKYDVSQVIGLSGGVGDDNIVAASDVGSNYLDSEATFYLDQNGMIVAVGDATENGGNYAFVWAGDDSDSGIDSDRVKVTLQDGTTKTYTLDSDTEKSIKDVVKNLSTKGTTGKGSAGIDHADEIKGRIYAYSIDSKDEILLKDAAKKTAASTSGNVGFEKGKTAVSNLSVGSDQTKYASASTVFFYVNLDSSKNIDDVDVYTGYADAPTVDNVWAEAAYNNGGNMAAVSFIGGSITSKDVADHLYVTDIVGHSKDTTTVKAILPGSDTETEIKVDAKNFTIGEGKSGLYLFTKNSDDTYKLTSATGIGSNYVKIDSDTTVDNISSKTMAVKESSTVTEYKLTDKTVLVEVDGKNFDDFDNATVGTLPSKDDKALVREVLVNSDDEILMIVKSLNSDSTKPNTPEVKNNITVDLATMKVTYTGTKPTVDEVVAAVQAQLEKEGWTVKSIKNESGNQYVFTATKGLLEKSFTLTDASAPEQAKTAKVKVSFGMKAGASGTGTLTGDTYAVTGAAQNDEVQLTLTLADGQTAKVTVTGGTNGTTEFGSGKAVTGGTATTIFKAGSTVTESGVTVKVVVSQNGYADNTQTYTLTIA